MPTPYAKVLVSVNGGANTSGGLDVPSGALLTFTPESIVGWERAVWEFYDYPEGWATPAGWSLGADGIISYAGYTPPPITLPANTTLWGVWMLRLRVNAQALDDTKRIADLLDDTTCFSMLSPKGLRDIGARERAQYTTSTTRIKGWLRSFQRSLRTIESQLGGLAVVSNVLSFTASMVGTLSTDGKSIDNDYLPVSILTTNATPTDLFTFATQAGRTYYVSGFIEASVAGAATTWCYRFESFFDNNGGTLTRRISPGVTSAYEGNASADLALETDGATGIRLRVTGIAATTIRWRGRVFLHQGIF